MIKPALLYEDQLKKKFVEQWYQPLTEYYCGISNFVPELDKSNEHRRQLVSVDEAGNVIGYIAFNVNWTTRSAEQWGMISFDKGNLKFVRDLRNTILDLFYKENFNRVEWRCFADNLAGKGYDKFIKRYGGRVA